jgi:hypothetical protein
MATASIQEGRAFNPCRGRVIRELGPKARLPNGTREEHIRGLFDELRGMETRSCRRGWSADARRFANKRIVSGVRR